MVFHTGQSKSVGLYDNANINSHYTTPNSDSHIVTFLESKSELETGSVTKPLSLR